jgi:hypothetical protein
MVFPPGRAFGGLMTSRPEDYFSATYAEARGNFLEAARRAGCRLEEHRLPHHQGPSGEVLAMDCAVLGPEHAPAGLVLVSATHGVEGFCGSACQTGLLAEGRIAAIAEQVRVVLIHAHNPYGFAWLRRVNEDNVDLNRNYLDHHRPHPASPTYDALAADIAPTAITGPDYEASAERLRAYSRARGAFALQQAITAGQYRHPTGLYYGGAFPAWSQRTLTQALPNFLAHQKLIALVDYHSGLGPFGHGEIISEFEPGSPGDLRLKAWFGGEAKSTRAGESVSAELTGTLDSAVPRLLAGAETLAFAIEFGTIAPTEVFQALQKDNWLHLFGDPTSAQAREIKSGIRRAFYPDTDEWKRLVWARSCDVVERTARGLEQVAPAG